MVAQIATPWDTRFSPNPMIRNGSGLNVAPSAPVTTAPAASSTAIQVGLDSRLVAGGVTSAADA